ncbi:Vps51; component of GARP (Golgi-associated retrograde protein) and EARP (endosome-associated recycling protein) complexes [Paratrimastix pyriformis]|uniref:Vps51 n=1 Tax=Paratrimastix pyriformis TaxID=342808 RepID=A0ABQ8UI03_9EUKA|nr:Vps51; component of GARP (Golgi-associated retrograde protein) and EARP (endosome-associated recycling protein) complexes [Paratrimastix pyriformis]
MSDPSRRSRFKNLMASFYGVGSKEGQPIQLDPHDIDAAGFEPDLVFREMLQDVPLETMQTKTAQMEKDIKRLNSRLQTLVYENYSKFLDANETIRTMKGHVGKMEEEMAHLSANVEGISKYSDSINSSLDGRRAKIDQLTHINTLLQKLQFLFELPAKLRRSIELEAYAQTVRYYHQTSEVLEHYRHIPSFNSILEESKAIIDQLKVTLLRLSQDPNLPVDSVTESLTSRLATNRIHPATHPLRWLDLHRRHRPPSSQQGHLLAIVRNLQGHDWLLDMLHYSDAPSPPPAALQLPLPPPAPSAAPAPAPAAPAGEPEDPALAAAKADLFGGAPKKRPAAPVTPQSLAPAPAAAPVAIRAPVPTPAGVSLNRSFLAALVRTSRAYLELFPAQKKDLPTRVRPAFHQYVTLVRRQLLREGPGAEGSATAARRPCSTKEVLCGLNFFCEDIRVVHQEVPAGKFTDRVAETLEYVERRHITGEFHRLKLRLFQLYCSLHALLPSPISPRMPPPAAPAPAAAAASGNPFDSQPTTPAATTPAAPTAAQVFGGTPAVGPRSFQTAAGSPMMAEAEEVEGGRLGRVHQVATLTQTWVAQTLRDLCPLVMSDMKVIGDQPLLFTRVLETRLLDLFDALTQLALLQTDYTDPRLPAEGPAPPAATPTTSSTAKDSRREGEDSVAGEDGPSGDEDEDRPSESASASASAGSTGRLTRHHRTPSTASSISALSQEAGPASEPDAQSPSAATTPARPVPLHYSRGSHHHTASSGALAPPQQGGAPDGRRGALPGAARAKGAKPSEQLPEPFNRLPPGVSVTPGGILLFALAMRGLPQAMSTIEDILQAAFSTAGPKSGEPPSLFSAAQLATGATEASNLLLLRYVRLRTQRLSEILEEATLTPSWLEYPQPTGVRDFVEAALDEVEDMAEEVRELLPAAAPTVGGMGPLGPSASPAPAEAGQARASTVLERDIERMFQKRMEIFNPIEFTAPTILTGIVKRALKTWVECMRRVTLTRFGYHQVQLDTHYLMVHLRETCGRDRSIESVLDAVLVAAAERCQDPVRLQPEVIESLVQQRGRRK